MGDQDYKMTVVQTTRSDSTVQSGWANLTLDLVIKRENSKTLDLETEGDSACFSTAECFQVALDSPT